MSYDVSIGGCEFNYTYNVSQLFYDHIPKFRDRGGLSELHGLTGRKAVDVLEVALNDISRKVHDPAFAKQYDPANGWGSTIGAITFLACILAACASNPRSKVTIS